MATRPSTRVRRVGAVVCALTIAVLASACTPGPAAAPPASAPPAAPAGCGGPGGPPDATTRAIYDATNASRASAGLGPLRWDPVLWCLASEWSRAMGDSRSMHHRDLMAAISSPQYAGYRTLGENVLEGPTTLDGSAMHSAWMNSPTHRANILSGAYASFAVATYVANGEIWATENFGG